MSKIAEKKVKELGYNKDTFNRAEYTANDVFNACVECYDQAMQAFLEKACEWLEENAIPRLLHNNKTLVEQFKNYIENEM